MKSVLMGECHHFKRSHGPPVRSRLTHGQTGRPQGSIHFREGDGCRHRTGDHKGPPNSSSPRSPLLYDEAVMPRPCIVGAGEDGMWGWGPCGCPSVHISSHLFSLFEMYCPFWVPVNYYISFIL